MLFLLKTKKYSYVVLNVAVWNLKGLILTEFYAFKQVNKFLAKFKEVKRIRGIYRVFNDKSTINLYKQYLLNT